MSSAFGSSSGDPDPASNTMVEVRHTASAVSLDRLRIPMETEPVFALAQAVAGMESLRNFADVVISLRPELAAALSAAETNTACAAQGATTLNAMLNDSFRLVPLMCTQIYRRIARSMLAFEPVANGVRNRLWTPKEPSSQHNSYVDMLLQLVQQLNVSITSLSLPHHVHTALLEEGVGHVARQLVDAYAHIKKANDEGRALMTRDVKVFQAALDNLLRRNLLPASELSLVLVEAYAGVATLPCDQLLSWVVEHRGYSIKQMTATVMVVGVGASILKKKEQLVPPTAPPPLCQPHPLGRSP